MPQDLREQAASCVECGDDVAPANDRVYPVFRACVICMDCARKRGGVYDAVGDRWEQQPRLDDLREGPQSTPKTRPVKAPTP